MANSFKGKFQIDDGYVGGSRPQYFGIDEGCIDEDMTSDELETLFMDMADDHFRQNIGIYDTNEAEFLQWARDVIAARKS